MFREVASENDMSNTKVARLTGKNIFVRCIKYGNIHKITSNVPIKFVVNQQLLCSGTKINFVDIIGCAFPANKCLLTFVNILADTDANVQIMYDGEMPAEQYNVSVHPITGTDNVIIFYDDTTLIRPKNVKK